MEANIAAKQKPGVLSLLGALLIVVMGGGLVGMAAALVGALFYLAIVFPIGMGFAGSMVAGRAARVARLREKSRVLLVFVLTALVVYGSFHYGRYLLFQLGSWLELSRAAAAHGDGAQMSMTLAKGLTNYALRKATGLGGFPGYIHALPGEGRLLDRQILQREPPGADRRAGLAVLDGRTRPDPVDHERRGEGLHARPGL
jgi:hypothetical protein